MAIDVHLTSCIISIVNGWYICICRIMSGHSLGCIWTSIWSYSSKSTMYCDWWFVSHGEWWLFDLTSCAMYCKQLWYDMIWWDGMWWCMDRVWCDVSVMWCIRATFIIFHHLIMRCDLIGWNTCWCCGIDSGRWWHRIRMFIDYWISWITRSKTTFCSCSFIVSILILQ